MQQAFTRLTVSEGLKHGEVNAPYLQRKDINRANTGLGKVKAEKSEREVPKILRDLMASDFETA